MLICTDGQFDNKDQAHAESKINEYISPYPSMHTIYLGFMDAFDLKGSSLCRSYKFTPYLAKDPSSIIDVMQDIANQMSGRYTLPEANFKISGNTVTVDLNQYEYSFKNVSVIVQNSGARSVSAKYEGKEIVPVQQCFFNPKSLNMKSGYSAVFKGDPYMYGGKLELTFDTEVKDVAVLAEPALNIEHYYEYLDGDEYKRVDMQYINSHLRPDDKIRIGYEVREKANNKIMDLEKLFGEVETKVSYAEQSGACGDEFSLVLGTNEVSVSVSVMGGKYTMYSSDTCIVESDPTHYRIEDKGCPELISSNGGKNPSIQSLYTVYVSNAPIGSKDALEKYTVEHSFVNENGEEITSKLQVNPDGTLTALTEIPFGAFGQYTETLKVISPDGISREHTHSAAYVPTSVEVKATENAAFTLTESQLSKNGTHIRFELMTDGAPINFDSNIISYSLTIGDVELSSYAVIEGNVLTYVPNSDTLSTVPIKAGELEIKLVANLTTDTSIMSEASANIIVERSSYVLEAIQSPNKRVDRFALDESTAVLRFRLLRDGEPMPLNEMQNLYNSGDIAVKDKGTFGSFVWLPCGKEVSVEAYEGYGTVNVRVTRDMINPFQTFFAMLILNGEKEVSVSCFGCEDTDSFEFTASSLWSYIWRILVILLVIHIILFIIGFFIAKSFPSGTFLRIRLPMDSSSKITMSYVPVNLGFKEKWLWHWRRFVFVLPFWGNQPDESIAGLAEIKFVKGKEKAQIKFLKNMRSLSFTRDSSEAGKAYQTIMKEISKKDYKGSRQPIKDILTSGEVRRYYKGQSNGAKVVGQESNMGTTPYGIFDSEQKLKEIFVFVKRKD